jgi:hypothetical protein
MRALALATALSLAAFAGVSHAQPGPGPQVTVGIGALLQSKAKDYGSAEIDRLRRDLGDEVTRTLSRRNAGLVRADLVIEDAQPNRPTMEQLSRTPGLSLRSIGLGGARISGTVTLADGTTRPIRFQFYETDLHNEIAANTWSDADRAFSWLAGDLARGNAPNTYTGPGPDPRGGHFGYPFNGD